MLGDCHINVEVSCTVNLIMYSYKCIFKGPDHAQYHVRDSVDEIQDYLQARYVHIHMCTCTLDYITINTPLIQC